jgi:signal transduction histidine kinase
VVKVRLRTKFLLSLLMVSIALTAGSLLVVRHSVNSQVRTEIANDLRGSVLAFRGFQQQREIALSHSAELLANLPSLKALMTTEHAATIQDASSDFWKLGGSDLFVLGDRAGKVVALHRTAPEFTTSMAQESLQRFQQSGEPREWWFGAGHLYEVFLRPIYFGPPSDNSVLGVLAVGYEIDGRLAKEISQISASQVAFTYGQVLVVSTLSREQEAELVRQITQREEMDPRDVELGNERYLAASLEMTSSTPHFPGVRLNVLKSYDQATGFLTDLYRLLTGLGLFAVLCEGLLVFLISRRFTRPLEKLVSGVRALEKGDFAYPLEPRGSDEVAEVTAAFKRMRVNLQKTQQKLLESERLATIGQMASSISHDLRHQLTAIVANSEFLSEQKLDPAQRADLYNEIRLAVGQMTDLIDSLLEFSRTREALSPTFASVEEVVKHAMQSIRANHGFHSVSMAMRSEGPSDCWCDAKKLERAVYNLLLNACQAVSPQAGKIEISIRNREDNLEMDVADNGAGVPNAIRDRLFEPFVSYGKENGTGLGLTIVQKIAQDHGGSVMVQNAAKGNTVFRLSIPLACDAEAGVTKKNKVTAGPAPARV